MDWNKEQIQHIADVVHVAAVGQWVAFGLVAFNDNHYLACVMYGVYFLALECIALAVLQYPKTKTARVTVLLSAGLALGALAICATLVLHASSPAYLTIAGIQSFLLASALGAALMIDRTVKKVDRSSVDVRRDSISKEYDSAEPTADKFEDDLQRLENDLRGIAERREEIEKEAAQLRDDEHRLRLEAAVNSVYAGLPKDIKVKKPLQLKRLFQTGGSRRTPDKDSDSST